MIPVKIYITIILLVLFLLWIIRKSTGQKGTWNSKEEIREYAILSGENFNTQKHNSTPNVVNNSDIKLSKNTDSIGEQICRKHLEKRLNTTFSKDRPKFLKNPITNYNLELDCFSSKLNLALEYNGRQHYEFVPKFHKTKSDFHNQKYRDDIKKKLCMKHGIDLIEVPYYILHQNIPSYIDKALENLGYIKFT